MITAGSAGADHWTRRGTDYSHIRLTYVAPFYFDAPNTTFMTDLLTQYAGYHASILDRVQFVLVDDASPVPVPMPSDLNLNMFMLRIRENKPWNQAGARNLGVVYARSDAVFATDIDHRVPEATFARLLTLGNPGKRIYKFPRCNADGSARRPAPNIFLMSRGRFLGLYGYDEEFCGAYGYEDLWFMRWQRYHGSRIVQLRRPYLLIRYPTESGYHSLQRDMSRNATLYRAKRRLCECSNPAAGHSRQFLRFTWDVVLDCQRSVTAPSPGRDWLWSLRWRWNKIVSRRR